MVHLRDASANGAVMPGAHQQINLIRFTLLIKKLKKISLPIHHTNLAGVAAAITLDAMKRNLLVYLQGTES